MRYVAACLAAACALGCGSAHAPSDGGIEPTDAETEPDAPVIAGDDASLTDAGDRDGGVEPEDDAGHSDAGVDGGPCDCAPSSECLVAECVDGACVEAPEPDGASCGEMSMGVCVAGVCQMRGCGDGYREPGPGSTREGCDDGNTEDGDACSSTCEPTPLLAYSDPGEWFDAFVTTQGQAIGVDGTGAVLLVWNEQSADEGRVRARRLTRGGVPVGDVVEVDPAVGAPVGAEPVVAGLAGGGWVVVWEALRAGTRDVVFRLMAADGTLGAERIANVERDGVQHEARVAAVGDGFVIVWTDAVPRTGDAETGVRARRFGATGTALAGEMFVAATRDMREERAQIASTGERWAVVWHQTRPVAGGGTSLVLRRFEGDTPRDPMDLYAGAAGARAGAITALADGNYALAWMEAENVLARVVEDAAPEYDPTEVVPVAVMSG